MSVSLQKGQKVNLSKEHAGLAKGDRGTWLG